jgi:hypothetical protein
MLFKKKEILVKLIISPETNFLSEKDYNKISSFSKGMLFKKKENIVKLVIFQKRKAAIIFISKRRTL